MIYNIQNKPDLEQKLAEAGNKLVVIDFYANWCGPCKIISPKLEALSTQYADKAVVVKINVDDCEEIAMEYNVTSMPTFVFIKNNKIIEIFVGGNSEKLVKNMEKYIGGTEPEPLPVEPGANAEVDANAAADADADTGLLGVVPSPMPQEQALQEEQLFD